MRQLLILFLSIFVLYSCNKDGTNRDVYVSTEMNFQQRIEQLADALEWERVTEREKKEDCVDPNTLVQNACQEFTKTYQLEYEGCVYRVVGTFNVCFDIEGNNDGGEPPTYISISDISIDDLIAFGDAGECTSYISDLVNLWTSGDVEELGDFLDIRDAALEQLWQDTYVGEFIGEDQTQSYICGTPGLDGNLVVKYYRGTCYQRCYRQSEVHGFEVINLRCGFGCCVKTTEYCIDARTGEIVQSEPVFEQVRACGLDPEPYPGGCLFLGPCRDNCSPVQ